MQKEPDIMNNKSAKDYLTFPVQVSRLDRNNYIASIDYLFDRRFVDKNPGDFKNLVSLIKLKSVLSKAALI